MKLKTQLISAFSFTILLVIIIAGICIYTTQTVNHAFKQVTAQAMPKLVILDSIKTTFLRMELEAVSSVLIGAETTSSSEDGEELEELKEFEEARAKLEKLVVFYQNLSLLSEEKILSEKLYLLSQQFTAHCMALAETEEPSLILENKKLLENVEDEFITVINSAISMADTYATTSSQFAHSKSEDALYLNLSVMLIAVILAIIFAYKAVHAIINPINKLQIAAEKLVKGEWKKIEVTQHHDELQQLTISFNEMATELCSSLGALESKNTALVRLNQEKNDFISIVVHDLKNPLSAILGMAEMIEESIGNTPEEELIQYATIIQRSSKNMFQLITNLLDINAIESGKISMLIEPTDILPIVQKLVREYSKRAQDKDIALHLRTEAEQYVVPIDKNTTHQILDNLISNAIKYSPIGKHVYIQLLEEKDKIRCEVQDEGIGLSGEDQKKLFGKFMRLTPKPTGNENSNGLGLFIVKKFVEAMNGKVWCESELGKGTKFIVEFFNANRIA